VSEYLDQAAAATGRPANVVAVLGLIFAALVVGSAARLARSFWSSSRPEQRRDRVRSLTTWWVLFALMAGVVLAGRGAAAAVFAAVSLIGLREFRDLARRHPSSPQHWRLAFLAVPVHYLIVYSGWYGPFWTFVPVWVFVILMARLVLTGETEGFLATAGITFLGLMLLVFLLSHTVLVLSLPAGAAPAAGPWGLFVYLTVLTEVNDIAQALWGRRFGRHKITPRVSPNKTWEGFALGAATTVALACLAAGPLTPFADRPYRAGSVVIDVPYLPAVAAGLLIAVGGFFGDITMSAVKRDAGVKDSGDLLPGQGGILDRIDSLTFTAPLFFYFTYIGYCDPGRGGL
jgi:phosphatidate cytidylyltransferase